MPVYFVVPVFKHTFGTCPATYKIDTRTFTLHGIETQGYTSPITVRNAEGLCSRAGKTLGIVRDATDLAKHAIELDAKNLTLDGVIIGNNIR
jgi:hypothetical protein